MHPTRLIVAGVVVGGVWFASSRGGATPDVEPPPSSTPPPSTTVVPMFVIPQDGNMTLDQAMEIADINRSATTTTTTIVAPPVEPAPETTVAPPPPTTSNPDSATLAAWRAEAVALGLPGTDEQAMALIARHLAAVTDGIWIEGAYIVQPGDTLDAIGERTGFTVEALAAASGITDVNELNVGQIIVRPA